MTEQKQVDIKTMSKVELWKLAFEQQEMLTALIAQMQQTQSNIAAIKAEVENKSDDE
jgi:hypothetical protein